MSRQLRCPNCGGDHTLVNPGITMLVCHYCQTVVYWGEDQVMQTGAQSILPESDARLFMYATGRLQDRGYQVVGHLRYDHGRGTWDEWYLQMDDGAVAWLSEDEREISLELPVSPDGELPAANALQVGMPVGMGGVHYTVREVGNATCVGGEGQLPFTILPGEQYVYADVASLDGANFGTLEYDEGARPTCFAGYVLSHEYLTIDDEKPPATAGAHEGGHIKCTNCAAPLEIPAGREVETKVCEYCGAQLDLTSAEQTVLGVNPKDYDPQFTFEVGQAGTFLGKPYEVCGRMLYEDNEGYQSREYLLHNPDGGYLWLAEEQGHFVLNRPTQQAPASDPFTMSVQQQVKIGDTTFKFFESGFSSLIYVDGALPWLARTGDNFQYADLIAPPQMFGVESDGAEVEYFHGRYLEAAEVQEAFKLPDKPRSWGVFPAQPFKRGAAAKLLMAIGGIFALVNLGLMGWSFVQKGELIFKQTFHAADYLKETTSKSFKLPGGKVIGVRVFAPLRNSWVSVDMAFLNSKDEVVAECDNSVEYYYGVEGGESWSEGSRSSTKYFKAPKPGNYRLILKASGGSGLRGPPRREAIVLRIYSGVVLSRYFIAAFIITLLFPLYEFMRKRLFETRRWAPVLEDDDDDDDWD